MVQVKFAISKRAVNTLSNIIDIVRKFVLNAMRGQMLYLLVPAVIAAIVGKAKSMEIKNVAGLGAILGAAFTLLAFLLTTRGQIGFFIQFIGVGVLFMSIVMNAIVASVLASGIFWVLKRIAGGN